uniref:Protein suppressor of hairy wing n=1 Tax=Cacopsylla melanoneura TaxID=428564 RepID=A0A8D8VZB7_9HEMI
MDHRSRGDMGFSTQLIRWWKSKLIGGYKNIQGMVEKHSDTEDLLQSDAGSILRDTPLPLSRLSNHYECEDMDGFIRTEAELNSRLNGGHQKRRNSTGTLDRLRRLSPAGNVREGLLVDLTNELKENQSRGGVQPVHLGREQRLRCETLPPGSVCPPTSHGKPLCNTPRECATENANCTHSLYSNGEFLSNQQRGRNCLCNHSNQVNRRHHHLTDSETNERRLYGNLTDFQDSRSPNTTKSPNQCKNEANSNYLNGSNHQTNSFHSNYEMNCSPQKTGCHSNKDANNSLYDLENISFHSKYETESTSCLPSKNGCLSNHIGEIRSHSNQGVNNGCHSNHDAENGCLGDSDGVDVVDSGAPRANNEQLVADLFTMAEEPKDLTYDLTVKEPAVATDKKKKRKEFALTLYDLEGRGQLNRHDIEGLVNKMLETLQQNKPHHTELQQPGSHQSSDNTKDTTTSSQQRSKAIRINFSISPQSTLSKSSPEGTLEHSRPSGTFNEGMDAVEQTLNEQCHRDVDSRLIDSVYDDEMNEKHNKFIDSLISQRHSISSENLIIPNSPEIGGGRRRTRSSMPSPKDSSVGEHLRRKLMKVAATSGRAELESLKENTSPNVNCGLISSQHHTASNDVGGHTMPAHELAGHNFAFLNDNSSTSNHSSFTETSKTACSNLANSTRLQTTPSTHQTTSPNHQTPSPNHQSPSPNHRNLTANDHSRTSPKTSTSAFQNLLSVSKKSCSTSAGKLSLLTSGSASGKRFSYEKLDDGGYYASFQGMRDGPIEEEDDTVVVDRVSHPPAGVPLCEPNVYVEHHNTVTGGQQRVRPPCLLPWEQNDSSCPLAKEMRRGGEYVSRDCVDGGKVVPPTPGGFSSLNTTAPEVAHHRATVFSQPTNDSSSPPLRSTAHATPRALRNYRNKSSSHSGAAARLRRRHSVCAPPAGGGGTGGLGGLLWPPPGGGVEDREADVSADQSADEEDEDSEFGNLKHFGGVSPLRNNSSDVRWRRRRSSSLLQRQELLQIIRANMEKNKSCFLQPRRKSSFHHNHHHHQDSSASSHLPFPYNQTHTHINQTPHTHINQTHTHPPHINQTQHSLLLAQQQSHSDQHDLNSSSQAHRRRYTTNSVLSQPTGLGALSEQITSGAFRNPSAGGTGGGKHQRPSTDLDQLTYQFEQHQERLNRSEQKRSRLVERPSNVAELTVANVTAKTLQQSREYKEYLPLPVVPVESRAVSHQARPVGTVSTPVETRHPFEQKKSSYQQHRYSKQNAKTKSSRRNHSFHFNKNDFVREENESFGSKNASLEYAPENGAEKAKKLLGKLNKNRSFHCTGSGGVEMNSTIIPDPCEDYPDRNTLGNCKDYPDRKELGIEDYLDRQSLGICKDYPDRQMLGICNDYPDTKLLGIRKHFAHHKKDTKSSSSVLASPEETEKDSDPIYDEINLAESKKLEQDLLSFSQPLYLSRRDIKGVSGTPMKEQPILENILPHGGQPTVQCFNLKLNENNRIVYDDSPLSRPANEKSFTSNHGNGKSFVYKQKLYASSPSTQQKILRRSKSGLIETKVKNLDMKIEDTLVNETSRLCLDSNADLEENDVTSPSKGNSRLTSPASRHQSPSTKKNGRFYKHYNLEAKILDKSESLNKSEEVNFLAHRPETAEFNENSRRMKSVSEMKTSSKDSPPKIKDHSGKSPAKSGSDNLKSPNKKCIEKRTTGGEVIKQSRVVRNLKTQHLDNEEVPSRDGNSRSHTRSVEEHSSELGMKPSSHEQSRSEGKNEVGVVNNNIYINTREHHLCCINVLEHTLCCHSNLTHDNFCCQGRKSDPAQSGCKPNNLIVNVLPQRTSEKNPAHALKATSSPARCHTGNALSPPEISSKSCSHQHAHRSGGHCSLHYLKHKYRDENERLAREQVIKWLENDFTAEEGKLTLDREFLRGAGKYRGKYPSEQGGKKLEEKCSDEEDLLIEESGSEEEDEEGTRGSPPVLSESELVESMHELLSLLIDEESLKSYGWPEASVDSVIEAVISQCGHTPATETDEMSYADSLRENAKLLFSVVTDDAAIKQLLNNQTVDQVILHMLRLAKS